MPYGEESMTRSREGDNRCHLPTPKGALSVVASRQSKSQVTLTEIVINVRDP